MFLNYTIAPPPISVNCSKESKGFRGDFIWIYFWLSYMDHTEFSNFSLIIVWYHLDLLSTNSGCLQRKFSFYVLYESTKGQKLFLKIPVFETSDESARSAQCNMRFFCWNSIDWQKCKILKPTRAVQKKVILLQICYPFSPSFRPLLKYKF